MLQLTENVDEQRKHKRKTVVVVMQDATTNM